MSEPPPTGPSSDLDGATRGARAGVPNRDPKLGTAQSLVEAEEQSAGRPPNSGKMAKDEKLALTPSNLRRNGDDRSE
jgi:hypothetical protein